MRVTRMRLWQDREDVVLNTFLSPEGRNGDKRPAVIVCPGGGYVFCGGEGAESDQVAADFYAKGYQAFVLEYTVSSRAGKEAVRYPAPLYDLGKAILTIRAHGDEWNVDTGKLVLCGFSAGAHLCGSLATHWHEPLLAERFGVGAALFRPAAVILCYPLTDFVLQVEHNKVMKSPRMVTDTTKTITGEENPGRALLEELSIYRYVSPQTPPLFLMHASDDKMVPALHSLRMARACLENAVPCELHMFQQGGHAFGAGLDRAEPYRLDKARACGRWLSLAQDWLIKQLAPETLEASHVL